MKHISLRKEVFLHFFLFNEERETFILRSNLRPFIVKIEYTQNSVIFILATLANVCIINIIY